MSTKTPHDHSHGPGCGHTAVEHVGHTDYLKEGHLQHQEGSKVAEHRIEISAANPAGCHKLDGNTGHDAKHKHGPGCGHEAVPHGDHVDYLVDGHLHHQHGDHCDDHGLVKVKS